MVTLRREVLLLLAVLIAYGPSVGGSFTLDDPLLLNDPVLASPHGAWEVFHPAQPRPLAWLTFWLNRQISIHPFHWHLMNLLLHAAAAVAAWRWLRLAAGEQAGFWGALCFAVHPVQTQAAAYVFARPILLAALFCFLSALAWWRGKRWRAVAWYTAALLSKEEVAAFPAVLLFLDLCRPWISQQSGNRIRLCWRPLLRQIGLPIVAMSVLSICAAYRVAWAASLRPLSGIGQSAGISSYQYFLAQGTVIWRYARLLVWPVGLTPDPQIASAGTEGLLGWAGMILLLGTALVIRRTREAGIWLLAGFLLLLPSSSVFPAADLAADRRLYLPVLCVGTAAGVLLRQLRSPLWVPGVFFCLLAGLSVRQSLLWRDNAALWKEAARLAPEKLRPRIHWARSLPPAQALQVLDEARRLRPGDPQLAAERGRVLLLLGRPEEALSEFGAVLAAQPTDPAALNNRGATLLALEQRDAALADFRRSLSLDACFFPAWLNRLQLEPGLRPPGRCRFTPEQERALLQVRGAATSP